MTCVKSKWKGPQIESLWVKIHLKHHDGTLWVWTMEYQSLHSANVKCNKKRVKKKKTLNPQMQKQKFTKKNIFWCLHETPWSVMSAILHEWDMTFTVTLSMMSTYRKITCLNKINCHGQLHNHKNHTKCHPCIQNKKNKDKSSTGLTS